MIIKGRTFIVTGGSSGLGLATVKDLVEQGANVGILDLAAATGTIEEQLGRDRVKYFVADVIDSTAIQKALESIQEWTRQTRMPLGGVLAAAGRGRLEKLVNSKYEPLSMARLDATLDTNLRGVLNFLRLSLPYMMQTEPYGPDGERGVIVLVSSAAAKLPGAGQASYAASKGAVRSLTLALAREMGGYGIRCMSIAPGIFDTPILRAFPDKQRAAISQLAEFPKREGLPKEFAFLVRHCIENTMLNGECIKLDGGARFPAKF